MERINTNEPKNPEQNKIVCKYCGSHDTFKNGVTKNKKWDSQVYICHTCKKFFCIRCEKRQVIPEAEKIKPFPVPVDSKAPFSWALYNEAQVQEKLLFLDILEDLCSRITGDNFSGVGRPKASITEMVFCMVAKLYEGLSSRRVSSDLQIAMQRGHITKVPHFNTILKYFNNPALTPLLTDMIRLSALPLKGFETTFAVDASGLSSAFYSRWLDHRINKEPQLIHNWIKIHVICGIKSNIVTAIIVTDGRSNDCPHFPELVKKTAEHFRILEVTADKGYSSRQNMDTAFEVGAVPYIPFKSNASVKARGTLAWNKMFHYFQFRREDFMARYHLRSNVESTFSSLKRKFSTKLMLKNEVGQVNEALAMVLCHNICVLIKESFENDISSELRESAHLFPSLHINSGVRALNG